jgi:hypothetical protein
MLDFSKPTLLEKLVKTPWFKALPKKPKQKIEWNILGEKKDKYFTHMHVGDGVTWFRIYGYGLSFKNLKKRELIFSERNGRGKTIGHYHIKFLKP